ncbi:MAG: hypothetical protein JWO48_2411 [Bryobacterales bacterium]|nr:hypothetical protein [Bryobacterales bacterium]
MRLKNAAFVLGVALSFAGGALAQEHGATPHTQPAAAHGGGQREGKGHAAEAGETPAPVVSEDGSWAGAMVIIILLGFFVPAAIIGPIVRTEAPEEVPPAHSHDEPPGASHHHGSSGTHAEDPHD